MEGAKLIVADFGSRRAKPRRPVGERLQDASQPLEADKLYLLNSSQLLSLGVRVLSSYNRAQLELARTGELSGEAMQGIADYSVLDDFLRAHSPGTWDNVKAYVKPADVSYGGGTA